MIRKQLTLKNLCQMCNGVTLYNQGKTLQLVKESEDFSEFSELYKKITLLGRQMPAFGVAIDSLTKEFQGIAFEFEFNEMKELDGMPFEKLFVRIDKDYYGINFERFIDGKYEGRCFYLNLDRNLNEVIQFVGRQFSCV